MPFRILIVGTRDVYLYNHVGPAGQMPIMYEFETGEEAYAFCKMRSASDPEGRKFRVKRVLDKRWEAREQLKFDKGLYQRLPWSEEGWWRCDAAYNIWRRQYPHPSRKEPGMIAYIQSPEHGMDNRKTRVKVGRYLEQFTPILDIYGLSPKAIADHFKHQFEPRKLLIADTEDMVQWVYEHGPHSCMSGQTYRAKHGWGWITPGEWPNDVHASRVYINGDLVVGYLTESDKPKGKVMARSVLWPAKKTYSRCYGDEYRMQSTLGANGYTHVAPIGAKLQRLPIRGTRLFVVPYIDAGKQSGQGSLAVVDKKEYLEIVSVAPNTFPANTTSGACGHFLDRQGRPQNHMPHACQRCGSDHLELYTVYTSGAEGDRVYWCVQCMEANDCYECAQSGHTYSNAMPQVDMANGEIWSQRAFRAYGFKCDGNGRNYPRTNMISMSSGAYWSTDYFADNGFRCDYSGDPWPNSERVDMADGHVMARTTFARHGFTCRSCERKLLLSDRSGRAVTGEQPQCVRCHTDAVPSTLANDPSNRQQRNERTEEHDHE